MRRIEEAGSELNQNQFPVIKATGTTNSERVLAHLAEQSFLDLWSYPTPYRDQRAHHRGDGKELCDLLVVCDPYILIFSVKAIKWPRMPTSIAWRRWAKRAIHKAAKQTAGAERWIRAHPERIFLDSECKRPFPLPIPAGSGRHIFQIVIVAGASEACRAHTLHGSGSFLVDPAIQGIHHWPRQAENIRPFAVGNVNPGGSFVHVFDEIAFEILMNELDTVRDFTDYLEKTRRFFAFRPLIQGNG